MKPKGGGEEGVQLYVYTGAKIYFGDKTPYLTYGSSNVKSSIVEERILRFVFVPSIVEERKLRFFFVPLIVDEQKLRFVFVPSIVEEQILRFVFVPFLR